MTINNEYVNVQKNTLAGFDRLDPAIRSHSQQLIPHTVEYDLRAMMYILGRRVALLATGQDIDLSYVQSILPVSTGGFVFDDGDIAYTPPAGGSALALTVFAQVAKECGVERMSEPTYVAYDVTVRLRQLEQLELFMHFVLYRFTQYSRLSAVSICTADVFYSSELHQVQDNTEKYKESGDREIEN